jgi:hypothetical protein
VRNAPAALAYAEKLLRRNIGPDILAVRVFSEFPDTHRLSPPPPPLVDSTQGSNALGFFLA